MLKLDSLQSSASPIRYAQFTSFTLYYYDLYVAQSATYNPTINPIINPICTKKYASR
jgi:hypothetical protein